MTELVREIRDFVRTLAPHVRKRKTTALLIAAADEIERLLRGDFTEDEFQNLCHNFEPDDLCRFRAGCEDYQKKLFGLMECPNCGEPDGLLNGTCIVCGQSVRIAHEG